MDYRPGFIDLYNHYCELTSEFREGVENVEGHIYDEGDLKEYQMRVAIQEAAYQEYQSKQGTELGL